MTGVTAKLCPSCLRRIEEVAFDRPSAHAPGCSLRRSMLAKENAAKPKNRKKILAAVKKAQATKEFKKTYGR